MAGLKWLDYTFKCLALCFHTPNKLNFHFFQKLFLLFIHLNKYLCSDWLAGGGRQNPSTEVPAGESPEQHLPRGTWHVPG